MLRRFLTGSHINSKKDICPNNNEIKVIFCIKVFFWRKTTWEPQISCENWKGFNVKGEKKKWKKNYIRFFSSFQQKKTLCCIPIFIWLLRGQHNTTQKNLGKIISFFERPYVAAFFSLFQYSKRTIAVWYISVRFYAGVLKSCNDSRVSHDRDFPAPMPRSLSLSKAFDQWGKPATGHVIATNQWRAIYRL